MNSPLPAALPPEQRPIDPDDIDWNGMWKEKMSDLFPISETGNQEERWDQIAKFYQLWSEYDDYPRKLLQRIQMHNDWSVLDIGCGTGVITIAAAIRAKRVTALDISSRMLEILKEDADKRRLGNIRYLHRSWESIRIGVDIKPHDIVVTSRTIARTGDLQESLDKINQAAIRFAYVTAWGGEEKGFNQALRQLLGRYDQDIHEGYYIYNILHRMGIHPNIEEIECRSNVIYKNPEEALQSYQVLFNLSSEETEITREYLEKHLNRRRDGKFEIPETRTTWSLIWWKK